MADTKEERSTANNPPSSSPSVNVTQSGSGQSSTQFSDGAAATDLMQQRLSQMEQRYAEQVQLLQQQMATLTQFITSSPSFALHSSPSLRSSVEGVVGEQPSASSSLPIPPQVPRVQRRQSQGQVRAASLLSPSTPVSVRRTERRVSFEGKDAGEDRGEEGEDNDDIESSSGRSSVEQSKQWERASRAIAQVVKPFHGETSKDHLPVMDWVEKVDTLFSIRMKDRQDGRLDLVRQMLEGSALKWMNRRVTQLKEKQESGEYTGEVEWDVLRQPFIDAHLGLNTVETFKAELRTLRLGSKACPSPVELNKRFDHVAELAYPDRLSTSMATVLGDEYRSIIMASNFVLYCQVERNATPQTLDDWKGAVARHWAANARIKAASDSQSSSGGAAETQRGRGWYGRGGRGRGGSVSTSTPPTSLNAMMGSDEYTRGEGEEQVTEGEVYPELLNAVPHLSGHRGVRGGRGGRGCRGGGYGGAAAAMSAERQRLYNEQRCYRCKAVGHTQAACPTPPMPRSNGSVSQVSQLNM
jgi:hypothetical protein